jgi:hypothetical protein
MQESGRSVRVAIVECQGDSGWWLRVRQVPYNCTSNAAGSVRKLFAPCRAEAVSKLLCMIPCAN